MDQVKKSLNIESSINQQIEAFIALNPGMNFTSIANQALRSWLKDPTIELVRPKTVSQKDIEVMIEEDKDLLIDLSK